MIVIKTGKPLRKVFLKTGEEIVAQEDEFQEADFGALENVPPAELYDREGLDRAVQEHLAAERVQWQAETGRLKGEALEKGRAEGRAEAEKSLAGRAKVLGDLLVALSEEREKVLREAESEAVDLALAIARRFVDLAAETGSEVIKQSIKSAVRLVTEKDKLVLRVNPEDLEVVRGHQDDIIFIGDGIGRLDVRADKQVRRGGCVIETGAGNIDARVDTRMAEIEKALRQALFIERENAQERDDAAVSEH
ncbi:hypothetical protein LLH00_12840 [bacterium]|nr:hypothetical protein [bacterium]